MFEVVERREAHALVLERAHVGVGAELVVHGRLDRVEDRLGDLLHHGGEDEVLVVRVRVLLVTVGVHPDHGNTVFFRSGLQRTGSNGSGNGQDDVGALGDELLGGVVTVLHVGEVAGCGTVQIGRASCRAGGGV